MKERIRKLAKKSGFSLDSNDIYTAKLEHLPITENMEKFAELIIKECAQLNQEQSYELAGVIIDTEEGDGFDHVCLHTVKRVHGYLASNRLAEHFGVEDGQ